MVDPAAENDLEILVRSPCLCDAVASHLRETIVAGRLRPGERLIEQKMAAKLGVGQPTFREALRELEAQGLVRRSLKRGTCVSIMSPADYSELLEVWETLEGLSAAKAAVRMGASDFEELECAVQEMRRAESASSPISFHRWLLHFHKVVWAAGDNRWLERTLEQLTCPLFIFILLDGWPEARQAVEAHAQLRSGLESGSPDFGSFFEFWRRWCGAEQVDIDRNQEIPVGGIS